MKAQPCYLLFAGDAHADASFCETIGEAKAQFERAATQLAQYGQEISATLHFVDAQGDDWVEDPDRYLTLSPRGRVIMEFG